MLHKILLGFCMLMLSFVSNAQGIQFEKGTFKQALQKAKKENKLLFIDGYADWCAPCKKMEKTVFQEEEVGTYFDEHIVALKVDVEKGDGPKIKEKYDIQGLPGYVFIDGNDEVVYRFSRAMPTEEFMTEVTSAVAYSKDPNSLGRLRERYAVNKQDETLVRMYMDKMLFQGETQNYTDVLEHYLRIQKSVPDSSKAMVKLLADHYKQLVLGGEAERIISDNIETKAWKKHVRKDIREIYQKIPKEMITTTTEYAILKRDTTYLELAIKNASNAGFSTDDAQKKRIYTYYYLKTGQGEKYKAFVYNDIVGYLNNIDKEELRSFYVDWLERTAQGDPEALRISRPNSVRHSMDIYNMVKNYAQFARTKDEKSEALSWMEVAFYIRPNSQENTNNYANILYVLGHKTKAIELKEQAYEMGLKEGIKRISFLKQELDLMKAGEPIQL